ncbi:hypothetical protein BJ165DRAFT_1590508 [Panaeolus papilionaceus]|nr:hypothetical protein BJ165DRAFT_1590508 [Panaeolus papilionaceus]
MADEIVKIVASLINTKKAFITWLISGIRNIVILGYEPYIRLRGAQGMVGEENTWDNHVLFAQFSWDPSAKMFIESSFSCKNYEIASTILQLVMITIAETILVMRTHTLYRSKPLLLILATLCLISIINMLVTSLLVIRLETISSAAAINIRGCLSECVHPVCNHLLIGFWIPYLLFETLVFCLTLWKSYLSFRELKKARFPGRALTCIEIIARDGLVYYVVIMAVSIVNFLIWIVDPFASYLAVGLLKSLQSTICSRLLLNIRGMLEAGGTVTPSMIPDMEPMSYSAASMAYSEPPELITQPMRSRRNKSRNPDPTAIVNTNMIQETKVAFRGPDATQLLVLIMYTTFRKSAISS